VVQPRRRLAERLPGAEPRPLEPRRLPLEVGQCAAVAGGELGEVERHRLERHRTGERHSHGVPLYTRNVQDFTPFAEVIQIVEL
jgi:hypothetical protein